MKRDGFISVLLGVLLGLLFANESALAGDARKDVLGSLKTLAGINSDLFVAGVMDCPYFPEPSATNRCEAYRDCVGRGEKVYRSQIKAEKDLRLKSRYWARLANLYTNSENRLPDAIKAMQESYRIAKKFDKHLALHRYAELGILHLRWGEVTNCIKYHNAESCIFPLSNKARHKEKYGAQQARKIFLEYLKEKPDNEHVRWLLNIASMATGDYPHKVPPQFLIPESIYQSKVPFARFPDVAGALGLQRMRQGAGSILVDDLNADGFLDIVITPKMDCLGMIYFESDGHGGFVDKSMDSNLGQHQGTRSLVQADFDNDGLLDLYVSRGGWIRETDKPYVYNVLLKNLGGAKFKDVTVETGLRTGWNSGGSAAWVDFDKDGKVDLWVCNFEREAELFHNEGGKFRDVAKEVGVDFKSACKGSSWGDINGDGWPDLFAANYGEPNRIYLNEGGKKFKRDSQPLVEGNPTLAYTSWFFDVDNDGDLDLYVSAFNRDTKEYIKGLMGKEFKGDIPRLFRNDGKGHFEDATAEYGLNKLPMMTMGANIGDFNGDGYLDIYLGSGAVSFGDLGLHHAYLNMSGKKFEDITTAINMGNLQKGHGIAFADFENRGNQDVIAVNGGGFPGDKFFPSLYKNPGTGQHWLTVQLQGTNSNRSAIGARIRVVVKERDENKQEHTRDIFKLVGPGGSFGSNPLRSEIGLGQATSIERLEVTWPDRAHTVRSYKDIPMDRFVAIIEGENTAKILDTKSQTLQIDSHAHHQHVHTD